MSNLVLYFGVLLVISPDLVSIRYYYMDALCGEAIQINYNDQTRLRLSAFEYDYDMKCTVTLQADSYNRFLVHFESMDIEYKPDCGYDFLTIYDGPSEYSSTLYYTNKICGQEAPNDIRSLGSSLRFYFQSDAATDGHGFDVIITPFHSGHCDSDEYSCDNGYCIDHSLLCSNYNPCGDHSDCSLKSTTGLIVGSVVGSLVVLVIIIIIIALCRRRRNVIVRNPVMGVATVQVPMATRYPPPPPYTQITQFSNQRNYAQPPPYTTIGVDTAQSGRIPFPPASRVAMR